MFNWLIGGTDAHAKNYSLTLTASDVRLAPIYDVASFLPYDSTGGPKVKMAMSVGGDYRLIRPRERERWGRLAAELGVPADALVGRAMNLAERIGAAFANVASDPLLESLESDFPERLTELVTNRAAACARALE